MNLRPAAGSLAKDLGPVWAESVPPAPTDHAGLLDGATATGEAARRQLSVRIGLWLDDAGNVRQARWRATKEPALRAYAEAACAALEAGLEPWRLDGAALRHAVPAGTSSDPDLADLVASAVHASALLGAIL